MMAYPINDRTDRKMNFLLLRPCHLKGYLIFLLSLFTCLVSIPLISSAQNTLEEQDPDGLYKKGLELMDMRNYGAARRAFEHFLSNGSQDMAHTDAAHIDAAYYRAYCAVVLFNDDGERLMEDFIRRHPDNPKATNAYFDLGNFYYRDKQYTKASEYFEKVQISNLSNEKLYELKFKLGYAEFNNNDTTNALDNFNFVTGYDNSYRTPAAYYAGYLDLLKKDYSASLKNLNIAAGDNSYKEFVTPLLIQNYYEQGNYEQVVQAGTAYVQNSQDAVQKPSVILMLADASYRQNNFGAANQYFNDYLTTRKNESDKAILLKAGISAYRTGYYIDAAEFLKQAALAEGKTGQLASYYLGFSYINLDNKPYALSAFDAARKGTEDKTIEEEATFYFGKLSFDLGNFSDAAETLSSYNTLYPKGTHRTEANELLSAAYLKSDNYDQAIAYIESLSDWTDRIKETYQKVTYRKGTELFNTGDYPGAVAMFQRSLKYPIDKDIVLSAWFWTGEAYSVGRKYDDAIRAYSEVFRNDPGGTSEQFLKARYGIGYAYYNTHDYAKALGHFQAYTDRLRREGKNMFYNDALLRLADCYYATKNYDQAITTYNAALKEGNPEVDYCYFQLGMVYGIQSNLAESFRNFDIVLNQYPASVYYDDALYYKAQYTFENGDYEPAIQRFTTLINKEPQSPFIPYALVSRAVAEHNLKDYSATISDYERVLQDYPRHPVANSPLLGLQESLAAVNRTGEFSKYLDMYKQANPGSKDLEGVEFESAKSMYYNQKYNAAIDMLNKFISDYQDSPFNDEVVYYLGESYYNTGQADKAISAFTNVTAYKNSKWFNRAIERLGDIYYKQGNYQKSIVNYGRLSGLAGNRREKYDALAGLMQSYFGAGKYDSTIYYANGILNGGSLTAGAQSGAQLFLGKAYLAKGNSDEAMDHFLSTVNAAKDENGAEAQYLMATIFRSKGNYRQSNETLYDLNNNFSMYEKWIGKSFLLLADNFISMGETFQAKATLNSVITKSPDSVIVALAKKKLNIITSQERVAADTLKNDTIKKDTIH